MKNTAILLFVFMSSIVYAQNKTADDFNLSKTRLAVQGYDVVSYFNDEPKEGDKAIQSTVEGVHYYFSSQKNKAFYNFIRSRIVVLFGSCNSSSCIERIGHSSFSRGSFWCSLFYFAIPRRFGYKLIFILIASLSVIIQVSPVFFCWPSFSLLTVVVLS